jgi:Flp pilus assembly pilin Flp
MLKLYTRLQAAVASLRDREEGQTMAEYGVVLGVITIALVLVFGDLAGAIEGAIDAVIAVLPS